MFDIVLQEIFISPILLYSKMLSYNKNIYVTTYIYTYIYIIYLIVYIYVLLIIQMIINAYCNYRNYNNPTYIIFNFNLNNNFK